MPYDHISLEQKWQKFWEENETFKSLNPLPESGERGLAVSENQSSVSPTASQLLSQGALKPKKFILDMFPYPSGAGLHVGHPKGYTATDIVSRFYHARGFNVLHTMGWDAFGLPAENYAIKTGTHPAKTTAANIAVFKEQLHSLGFSYDWSREIDTTDPGYYQWTQWIFLELFKKGLAYEQDLPINYCPSCKTGLANEEVLADNTCDRCGTLVERRPIRQWVLKITEYADRLIEDLDGLDWPEGVKEMQRNWIGKSEGCEFRMMKKVEGKPTALILHGLGDVGGAHWAGWLSGELRKIGYEVYVPTVPFESGDMSKCLEVLNEYKQKMNESSLVIGHSMGSVLGMKFIESLNTKIDRFISVAGVFEGMSQDKALKSSESLREISDVFAKLIDTKMDYEKIRKNTTHSIICTSDNDSLIDKKEQEDFFRQHGFVDRYIVFPGKDHFSTSRGNITKLPELLAETFDSIEVYTTRVDTVYGMTYAVLAPDHPRVYDFITDEQSAECEAYITEAASRSDQDRTNEGKEKTGVFTGSYVVNPFNGESVQLWIADYVLGHYGTGAVMAVPAHDERDFAFAKKYKLGIKCSIWPVVPLHISDFVEHEDFTTTPSNIVLNNNELNNYFHQLPNLPAFWTEDGKLVNSPEFINGYTSVEARRILFEKAESEDFGRKKVNYKLRDWLFSRQRYWGEPIPLIHISNEDYAKLPRIEKLEDAKTGEASVLSSRRDPFQNQVGESNNQNHLSEGKSDFSAPLRNDKNEEYLIIDGKAFSKIYDGINGKIVIDSSLPLELPQVEKYEPAGDGQSPLATVPSFVNVKLAENLTGKRETNTMPQWGGSCWYYLRYMDPKNSEALAGKEAIEYWQNVDEYVGGAEHAVLHLLYARFWHKVLYDIGVVSTKEPFHKLTNVGMILAYAYERADGGLVAVDLVEEKDGKYYETSTGKEVKQVVAKMSKSLKNVINPNDIVREHGADTLRLYEMSMGAFTDTAPWNPEAIIGVRRFLDKAYATFTEGKNFAKDDMKAMKLLHKTVKKVGEDIVEYKFNTAIAALQILINEGLPRDAEFAREWKEKFATILHPFAPHMAEELWGLCHPELVSGSQENNSEDAETSSAGRSVYFAPWPEYEEFMLVDDEVTIAVQVGGKLRGTFTFLNGVGQEEVSAVVRADEGIKKWLEGKEIVKEIFIPNKMLSIVIKG